MGWTGVWEDWSPGGTGVLGRSGGLASVGVSRGVGVSGGTGTWEDWGTDLHPSHGPEVQRRQETPDLQTPHPSPGRLGLKKDRVDEPQERRSPSTMMGLPGPEDWYWK